MQLATAQATQAAAARREALSWLARRLRWEHTLDELRHDRDDKDAKRAA
jgi:hypothetical protein